MGYLESKIVPPPMPSRIVPWKSLTARLNEGFSRRLTLVAAIAGAGKTTYLHQFFRSAASYTQRCAWLSLDVSDNAPKRFWKSFFGALDALDLGLTPKAMAAFNEDSAGDACWLTELLGLVNEASFEIFLVIDNYEEVRCKAIHNDLMFWIEHMPSNMHIALASRSIPPLSLSRLRGCDQLVEVDAKDLFLDFPETMRYMRLIKGIDAPDNEIHSLFEMTGGWIAGLQLAAASYLGSSATARSLVSVQAKGYIKEYLLNEVYSEQEAPVREFLLKTSILSRLTSSLCRAVVTPTLQVPPLDRLARLGLFLIPLDNKGEWYRYHALFAETLRHQLMTEKPDGINDLLSRAGAWSERKGLLDDAIEYALEAGEDNRVMELFEQAMLAALDKLGGELFVLDEARHHRWIHSLSEERYSDEATFFLLNAWSHFISGCPDESKAYLARAKKCMEGLPDEAKISSTHAIMEEILSAIEAGNTNTEGDYRQAIELSQLALTRQKSTSPWFRVTLLCLLGEAWGSIGDIDRSMRSYNLARVVSMAFRGKQLTQFCSYEIGRLHCQRGQFEEALETWQKALPLFEPESAWSSLSAGLLCVGMGTLHVMQGDVEQAENCLKQALSILADSANLFLRLELQTANAYLLKAKGRVNDALDNIASAVEIALPSYGQIVPHSSVWRAFVCYAKLSLGIDDAVTASKVLDILRSFLSHDDNYYRIESDLIEAMVLECKGEREQALRALDIIIPKAREDGYQSIAIEALVLRAGCLHALGQGDAALIEFELTLDMAERMHFVYPFTQNEAAAGELLYKVLYERRGRHALSPGKRLFCRDLLDACEACRQTRTATNAAGKPKLTKREEDVLDLMGKGFTQNEIARRLHISTNTVKTHVRNIYGKLDVDNRAAAMRVFSHGLG